MKDQFQSTNKLETHEARTMERDMEAINRKEDSKLAKRHQDRKAKEMEAKNFQDRQVQEKLELKKLE